MQLLRWKDAVTTFEMAVEQDPGLTDAWLSAGICYARQCSPEGD